jgi:hypothetical protein
MLVSLLIGTRSCLVALLGAGMLELPRLALAVKPGVTGLGVLLEPALAFGCFEFTVADDRQLRFELPAGLTETLKPPQLGEPAGQLLALSGGGLGLPGRILRISERVDQLGVVGQGGDHPRRLVTLSARAVKLRGGLVALLTGTVKPDAVALARIRQRTPRPLTPVSVGVRVGLAGLSGGGGALPGVLARDMLLVG